MKFKFKTNTMFLTFLYLRKEEIYEFCLKIVIITIHYSVG
jgi:hypothetical protein